MKSLLANKKWKRESISAPRNESGIALVITLVMLAIVTVMAIVFLAMSRRERASVKLMEDAAIAQSMAEAAMERAKAQAIAQMNVEGSKLYYDLYNSTNFLRASFDESQSATSLPDPENVSYYNKAGKLISGPSYLRMLANMQYDGRPPVFVETNRNGSGDFRFYLDFNRNRLFETNGILPVYDTNGLPLRDAKKNIILDRFVGDPEWVGVLERPDLPHSETNRFIGRLAYLVLPAGKSLDLNFIHNHTDPSAPDAIDTLTARNGFLRNEGVGSWELNLAAFLRELNTNNYAWHSKSYSYKPGTSPAAQGLSFDDARAMLSFRYLGRRSNLASAINTLGVFNIENPGNGTIFDRDQIDNYSDDGQPAFGSLVFKPTLKIDNDLVTRPWPGSLNTNAFTDIQQLYHMNSPFSTRLENATRGSKSSYDRYTFYRLAAQLGADSVPAIAGKLHLNFENPVGQITNTVRQWTNSVQFFTTAADLMLKASIDTVVTNPIGRNPGVYYLIGDTLVRTNFSVTNIQVYFAPPTNAPFVTQNEYTPTIHRILQVAANIYDNMADRDPVAINRGLYFPTVFQPSFTKTTTNLIISGFVENTNARSLFNPPPMNLAEMFHSTRVRNGFIGPTNVYGQHLVIGVKKGHPNFNELSLKTDVEVSRKLQFVKTSSGTPPTQTNQMFIVSMQNRWGMEAWNSYTNLYPGLVRTRSDINSDVYVRDGTNLFSPVIYSQNFKTFGIPTVTNWPGVNWLIGPTNFVVTIDKTFNFLDDQAYIKTSPTNGFFAATNVARFDPITAAPQFIITATNDVRFIMMRTDSRGLERIIDFVSFDRMPTITDLRANLHTVSSGINAAVSGSGFNDDSFWDPTPVAPGSPLTIGLTNQIAASAGELFPDPGTADRVWRAYKFNSPDREGAVALFRKYMGYPTRAEDMKVLPPTDLRHDSPFVPTRRMTQIIRWQANDPLVHYMPEDLTHVPAEPNSPQTVALFASPAPWNIGAINRAYRPWGGNPYDADEMAYNIGIHDPGIRKSDDWEFPINTATNRVYFYPTVGALGQVHRGTPWQTIYLKSIYAFDALGQPIPLIMPDGEKRHNDWRTRVGSVGSYPAQDWKLLDVFTAAPNENAARGLLSVNQENSAAWAAVLGGVTVATNSVKTGPPNLAYTAAVIDPATRQFEEIVRSINFARSNQWTVVPNPNPATASRGVLWASALRTNQYTGARLTVFEHAGDVLGAPQLSVQSPYLKGDVLLRQAGGSVPVQRIWTDRAVEYIPQQVLSLLQRDEPRFVVYAFGQSLKPAPHSLTSDPNYYHMCTNYQITGEVISKATFRVEGELPDPKNPLSLNNPLRTVVESYEMLPPPD